MKLVAAKCPSCGANIEVDKNSDSTKCEYCKTKIIVDDAINKYKLEVEVKNMPNINNYLKLGKRYYDEFDYEESNNYFSKALELEPDNLDAIFYKGITKTLCTTYKEFDLYTALKATKNVLKKIDDKKLIDKYALELELTNTKLKDFAIDFYNNHNLSYNSVEEYIERLKICLLIYEYCCKNVSVRENKIIILNKILNLIKYILKRKVYRNEFFKRESYYVSLEDRLEFMKKLNNYKKELYILDPNKKIKDEENMKKRIIVSAYILIEAIIISMFIKSLTFINPIWSIIIFVDFLLILPIISKKIFKNNKIGLFVKLLLFVIGLVGLLFCDMPDFLNNKYISKTNDLIIEFKDNKVKLNSKEYEYIYEEYNSYTMNKIEDYKFKYSTNKGKYSFCLVEKGQCKDYFYSIKNENKYIKY